MNWRERYRRYRRYGLEPLPAEASRSQSAVIDGHSVSYTVSVGWLPVRDAAGKSIAQVVYTA